MSRIALLVVLVGCGRVGFEPTSDAGDAALDAAVGCPATAVEDPVLVTGTTFGYMGFDGARVPFGDVTVRALSPAGSPLAMTTSNQNGDYQLAVPTGGAPTPALLQYALAGYVTTTVTLDAPLTSSFTAPVGVAWRPGDGPIWSDGSLGSVYSVTTATRDLTRGTVDVIVLDCADNPVAGATVTVVPPPEVLYYRGDNGTAAETSTSMRWGSAVLFNAPAGVTTITASHPTKTIAGAEIVVGPGNNIAVVALRAID